MSVPQMNRRTLIAAFGGAAAWPLAAHTQTWPAQVVHLVCPIAAGGGLDATSRIVAGALSQIWGQQVVVENKTGAGGNIAAEFVARSDPDGYTIYVASFPHAINRYLYPSLSYDPVTDFVPITLICLYPLMMVVPITSPAHSVREFIAYAKASKVNYASAGYGTSLHLAGELFKRRAGIEMTHVPYRGAGPAFNDLIPGRVDAMFNYVLSSLPLVRRGQLRALAVLTAKRLSVAPDLPTMEEAGVTGAEVSSWSGFFAPAGTPQQIVHKVYADTVAALAAPTIRDLLDQGGAVVIASTPDELASFLSAEMRKWQQVVKEANIHAE